jgi:hypothetical protein
MWPLSQQAVIIALHAAMAVLKLAGTPPPDITFGPGMCHSASLSSSSCTLCAS